MEQVGEQRNEYKTNEGDAAAGHELLDALRLRAGVVVAVALKEVDAAPDAEAAAESDNKSLKNVNSACKEIHIDFAGIIWDVRFVPEKSKAGMRPLSRLPIPAFSFQFLSWLMIRPDFAIPRFLCLALSVVSPLRMLSEYMKRPSFQSVVSCLVSSTS